MAESIAGQMQHPARCVQYRTLTQMFLYHHVDHMAPDWQSPQWQPLTGWARTQDWQGELWLRQTQDIVTDCHTSA